MSQLDFISYTKMLSLRKKALRSGVFRRLPLLQRGLFSAALEYARLNGKIVNQKLIGMVRKVAEKFDKSLGQKIFDCGIARAKAMLGNLKMMVFPHLRKWIDWDCYIFWLGTDLLVKQRSWIIYSPLRP